MMVVSVHFSTEELLNHTKLLLYYGYIYFLSIYTLTKTTTALRTAVASEYSLDKEANSYDYLC